MRIRNQDTAKPATTRKTPPGRKSAAKAPPGRKYAAKTPPKSTDSAAESAVHKTVGTKRGSAAKAKQIKNNEMSPVTIDGSDSNLERSAVEEMKPLADATKLTPETKVTSSVAKEHLGDLNVLLLGKQKLSPE